MSEKPPEDVSKQDLWNRLRRLEKEVFPNRRDMLKAGAGIASLGAAGMLGRASGDPGDSGETTWGAPDNRDSWYANEIDALSVSTGAIDITDETLIDVSLGASQSISSGSFETIQLSSSNYDELNEFDTQSYQFSPENDGWFIVEAQVRYDTTSDGDNLQSRFQDVSGGNTVIAGAAAAGGTTDNAVVLSRLVNLSSANSYELQALNGTSNDSLRPDREKTYLTVRSAFG